ncbi:MAG: cupin domain-containing protein [Opitutaceae bacterium]|nr:cupin domain-containing protein [Opitutaceae bacterium]
MSADHQPGAALRLSAYLGMAPIPHEGPLFVRTYESAEPFGPLPARYAGPRAGCTAILALITAQKFSALHRLATDELWFFHAGSPLELLLLHPGGRSEIVIVGADVLAGQRPQACVPRGSWVGARPFSSEPDAYALISNTLAPGFDYADYEPGDRAALIADHPDREELITALTRAG